MALAISGVTGTISNGQSVTITGTDFGATGPTVVLFDDFEKGTNGNIISVSANSAQVEEWDYVEESPDHPKYSNAQAHGGTLSMLADQSTGDGGHWAEVDFADTREIYLSYWVYLPSTCDVPGMQVTPDPSPNWKLGQILGGDHGSEESDYTTAVTLQDLTPTSIQGPNPWHDTAGLTESGYTESSTWAKGRWHRFENYYLGGESSNGILQMWETNSANARSQTISVGNATTIHSGDNWSKFRLHAYAREEANGQCYYDDVYVATGSAARARVEIGNNATYTSCTNLAVCTPTAWGDTEITATVRAGSFTTGTAYLFVVDASGNASAGKEITLGNTYGAKILGVSTGSISKIDGVAIASINKIFGYDF